MKTCLSVKSTQGRKVADFILPCFISLDYYYLRINKSRIFTVAAVEVEERLTIFLIGPQTNRRLFI